MNEFPINKEISVREFLQIITLILSNLKKFAYTYYEKG